MFESLCASAALRIKSYKSSRRDSSAGIFKLTIEARNRVGIGLSHWAAKLHILAVLIPWNRFLGSLKFKNSGLGPDLECRW
jgi:hypothetical protein